MPDSDLNIYKRKIQFQLIVRKPPITTHQSAIYMRCAVIGLRVRCGADFPRARRDIKLTHGPLGQAKIKSVSGVAAG